MLAMQTRAIYLASDHAGCLLRQAVYEHLISSDNRIVDLGLAVDTAADYPDYAVKLAMVLENNDEALGIAVCGSGIGISIALNRFSWVRAALVNSSEAANLSRRHNNANVLAFGERLIARDLALKCVDTFLATKFEGGRHQPRVDKLAVIGAERRTL